MSDAASQTAGPTRRQRRIGTFLFVILAMALFLRLDQFLGGLLGFWPIQLLIIGQLPGLGVAVLWLVITARKGTWRQQGRRLWVPILLLAYFHPVFAFWLPYAVGLGYRAKWSGDVPAIVAWAERQPFTDSDGKSVEPTGPERRRDVFPEKQPAEVRNVTERAMVIVDYRPRALSFVCGSPLIGHWGLTIGRGVSRDRAWSRSAFRISDDILAWND